MVSIRGVEWFEVIDPTRQSSLDVEAVLSSRTNSLTGSWNMDLGNDPREWVAVDTGSETQAVDGVITTLDLSTIPLADAIREATIDETIVQRLERVNQPAVTLRLKATDGDGNEGEMRKTFYLQVDPDLKPGFPLKMPGSGEASPIMVDMNGDGVFELIVADGSGRIHVLNGSGEELPGFPVQSDLRSGAENSPAFQQISTVHDMFIATPAAGDLDGDGDIEIVAAGTYGGVYAWHHDGSVVTGYPQAIIERGPSEITNEFLYDNGFVGAPALYDLDGSGTLEVIIAGMDSRLYIFDHLGQDWGGFPMELCAEELCGISGTRSITSLQRLVMWMKMVTSRSVSLQMKLVNNGSQSVSYLIDASTASVVEGWYLLPLVDWLARLFYYR